MPEPPFPPAAGAPGFGMIAKAGSVSAIDRAVACARAMPAYALGLLLRDPGHRHDHVAALARHLLAAPLPPNLVPIAGAHRMPGIPWLHLTSADLAAGASPGDHLPFGASAHDIEEGLAASRLGARYVTFSPIFPTGSKPGHPGVGLDALRAFCSGVPLPVFALGGIDLDNAPACIGVGARGIASISLFSSASPARLAALAATIERGASITSFPESSQP